MPPLSLSHSIPLPLPPFTPSFLLDPLPPSSVARRARHSSFYLAPTLAPNLYPLFHYELPVRPSASYAVLVTFLFLLPLLSFSFSRQARLYFTTGRVLRPLASSAAWSRRVTRKTRAVAFDANLFRVHRVRRESEGPREFRSPRLPVYIIYRHGSSDRRHWLKRVAKHVLEFRRGGATAGPTMAFRKKARLWRHSPCSNSMRIYFFGNIWINRIDIE